MKIQRILGCTGAFVLMFSVNAQPWLTGGNALVGGEILGATAASIAPLEIRHDGNYQIEWYTDALHRMGLYPNVNNVVNGYTINQTGYFGLSDQPAFFNGSGPFSKIHLVEAMGSTNPVNYAQELGYRESARTAIAN